MIYCDITDECDEEPIYCKGCDSHFCETHLKRHDCAAILEEKRSRANNEEEDVEEE